MNCANCGTELTLVFPIPMRRHGDYTTQYNNALAITFDGGYGMFFDFLFSTKEELTAVLCHDCAHAFVRATKWAMKLLENNIGELSPDRTADEFGHMHEGTDFGREGHGHD